MYALPPKADILHGEQHVRFVPIADIVPLRPIAGQSSSAATSKENRTDMEDASHDQNNHYCVCFGPRVIGTGVAACAHSAAGEHDHHRP
jgi:hypothetical protein